MMSADNQLNKEFKNLCQQHPVSSKQMIKEHLLSEIQQWKGSLHQWLRKENPFYNDAHNLKAAKTQLELKKASIAAIENDFQTFNSLAKKSKENIDENYWLTEIEKLKDSPKLELLEDKFNGTKNRPNSKRKNKKDTIENNLICRTLLQQQWQKLLDQQQMAWELRKITEYRQELLKRLSEWLELIQQLDNTLADLSIEIGLLFDLSKGNITLSDIKQLKRWLDYIAKDKGVKELCDLMGKLRRANKTSRQELVKHLLSVQEFVPNTNSKEEIVGIHFGREIERALPQELALLADDETSILFDMKFTEGRLMCFDMEGSQQQEITVEKEVMTEIEEEDKLGPIIICVDTSGSMHGSPETVAKAVTLFMATRAINQKRNCFLINFSTGIETLDLSGGIGISKVIEFLRRSFRGGTDAAPALNYALELMGKEDYMKADLLMISDFIMASLPNVLQEKINLAKQNDNKFYSLSIGNIFLDKRLKSIFDNEWVYNPSSSSVHSIQTMVSII